MSLCETVIDKIIASKEASVSLALTLNLIACLCALTWRGLSDLVSEVERTDLVCTEVERADLV